MNNYQCTQARYSKWIRYDRNPVIIIAFSLFHSHEHFFFFLFILLLTFLIVVHLFDTRTQFHAVFCMYVCIDVPTAPERPLITSFTSRSMNLSWAHSQEPRNAPVTHFLIETRQVHFYLIFKLVLCRLKNQKYVSGTFLFFLS